MMITKWIIGLFIPLTLVISSPPKQAILEALIPSREIVLIIPQDAKIALKQAISVVDPPQEVVKAYIRGTAGDFQVDPELAIRIINCESNFNRFAKSKKSSAESYFQFIDKTWEMTMIEMNLPTSTLKTEMPYALTAGLYLLGKDGTKHWQKSKKCWEI